MKEDKTQLERLIFELYPQEKARQVIEDISKGDALLDTAAPLKANREVLVRIKKEAVRSGLSAQTRRFPLKSVCAAACILFVILAGYLWLSDSDRIAADPGNCARHSLPDDNAYTLWHLESDEELQDITNELDHAMNDILEIPLEDYNEDRIDILDLLERETNEVALEDDFWKG